MRFTAIILASLSLFFLSCEDEDTLPPHSGGDPADVSYSSEDEPSLSPDGDFVYFITTDTLLPSEDGIHRANVSNPVRETVLPGSDYHSPVASPDGSRIAFLSRGAISYVNPATSTVTASGITGSYNSIAFVTDSMIVGCRDKTLYLIDTRDSAVAAFGSGYDPVFYGPGAFAYVTGPSSGIYSIMLCSLSIERDDLAPPLPDTLALISSSSPVRWASCDPGSGRFAYLLEGADSNSVYTSTTGSTERNLIAHTLGGRSLMVGFDMIIYRGAEGRLYQSNYEGTIRVPFWSVQLSPLPGI